MKETIEETTVGFLGECRVPMANVVKEGRFLLPDGSQGSGLACLLILPDGDVWVGVGSEVTVNGETWRVTQVNCPDDDNGSVTLETTGWF